MNTSLFELFKVGVGPSSSHTVGPMRAANHFVTELLAQTPAWSIEKLVVDLYGSLALTGIGHGTDQAILFGLLGEAPDTVDTQQAKAAIEENARTGLLLAFGKHPIPFRLSSDLRFHRDQMYPDPHTPTHPNGLRLTACGPARESLLSRIFYSVGGGFIMTEEEFAAGSGAVKREVPYPFSSAAELLGMAADAGLSIAEVVLANEVALLQDPSIGYRVQRVLQLGQTGGSAPQTPNPELPPSSPEDTLQAAIFQLWDVMRASIERGIATEGTLPGGLNVRRRAPGLARRLAHRDREGKSRDPLAPLDAVTLAAMAVNEETRRADGL